jgi:predicted PurR-regulated permease PerM
MDMKKFFKKGSAEIVSIVLGIVVIGGLALAVTGTLSKQTNASMNQGMKTQTQQLVKNYNEAATPQQAQDVTGMVTH